MNASPIVLGSQSPRRRDLLTSVVPTERLQIIPPKSAEEPGFNDCQTSTAIENRLQTVVSEKLRDVRKQLTDGTETLPDDCGVICADTIVVATKGDGRPIVLGKPPAEDWHDIVRHWFVDYYSDRHHDVWTCFQIMSGSTVQQSIVKTTVSFYPLSHKWIDWYLSTGESTGKAGGYGIQGQASIFVSKINGSLTNVIGLPLFEVAAELQKAGLIAANTEQSQA